MTSGSATPGRPQTSTSTTGTPPSRRGRSKGKRRTKEKGVSGFMIEWVEKSGFGLDFIGLLRSALEGQG